MQGLKGKSMVSTSKNVQALRQCEKLKTDIHGKSFEVANVLSEEFLQRQNLENLYKSVLLSDVQYALDNKVELDLWNRVFKEHIDNFRLKIKEKKKNNEKNDIQAKLSLFLDVSTGFYFQLLQEFCDAYNLDLPYHGKASQLGILSKTKKIEGAKPKLNACLYVCQDCLVHLGDLARYRNDLQQAQTFYTLAAKILPGNGQPYNQLAILASAKGNNLHAIFYYFKSISVPNPFPAASSNLQKTFCQMCAKHNYDVFTKTTGITSADFLEIFLHFSGSVFLMQDSSKLNALKDRLLQDFREILNELPQMQILLMMSISIFNLQKVKHKNVDISLTVDDGDDDSNAWYISLLFCVQFLQILLHYTTDMMRNQFPLSDLKCLPAIKLFSDWIVCSGSNILAQEAFQETSRLYYQIVTFANELLALSTKREKSVLPLMEDWEMHGVTPFRKIHRRYDYRIQPVEVTVSQLWNIRVSRIFHFIDWLCQQEHMSQFLAKAEQNGKVEYICKELPTELKSPLHDRDMVGAIRIKQKPPGTISVKKNSKLNNEASYHKTRSLFRTESEECGINVIPNVTGPVASYSLFESMWNGNLQSTPPTEVDALSVGSPNVGSLTNTMIFHDQQRPTSREQQSDMYCIPNPGVLSNKPDAKTVIRSLETPTYDVQLTNLSSSTANTNNMQQQQQQPANRQQQSPEFQQVVNQMAERMQAMAMVPQTGQHATTGNMMPSPTQPQPQQLPPRSLTRPDLWFKQVPPQVVPQTMESLQQQQLRQRNSFASNLPIQQQPFNSLSIPPPPPPDAQLHAQNHLVKNAPGVQPQHTFIAQNFSAQPSNFGVIGQNIRPPGLQVPGNQVFQPNFQTPTIPLMQRSWSAAAPPGIPDPMGEARRNIWTSNFGIGQSEISPLEQLIKDQRRHQQPR